MRVLCRRLLVAMFSMCRGGGFSVAGMAKRAVSYPKFTRSDASLGIFPKHFPFYPISFFFKSILVCQKKRVFFLGLFLTLIQKKACILVTMAFVLDLDMCWIVFFPFLLLNITYYRVSFAWPYDVSEVLIVHLIEGFSSFSLFCKLSNV